MIPQLSLTVLVENTTLTDRYFCGEPGLIILGIDRERAETDTREIEHHVNLKR